MNEQNNIQSDTPVEYNTTLNNLNETPTPKKSPVGGIIIALLVLVILGLVGYIAYDKGYLDKLVSKEEAKEEQQVEEPTEKEITDQEVISSLDKKIEIINLYGKSIYGRSDDVYTNRSNKAYDEDAKLYTILFYLYNNKQFIQDSIEKYPDYYEGLKEEDNVTDEVFDDQPYFDALTDTATVIKNDDVKKLFKDVYGNEPTTTKVWDDAPEFFYNEKNDGYYVIIMGGGTCPTNLVTYNYKYTEDDNNAYVYIATAYNDCNKELYKDLDRETKISDLDENTKVDSEYMKNVMDKLNKYRIVFKKDNGNYYFEKVEEVK